MKNILIAFIIFVAFSCNPTENVSENPTLGERIHGPANIRDTVNGKVVFTLNDNVLVECTEPKNEWHEIGILIAINKSEAENFRIKKGTILKDPKGNEIGKAMEDFEIQMEREGSEGFISGYTHKQNIKSGSVAENVLKEIIIQKGSATTKNDLINFILDFRFEKYDEAGNEYFIYENTIDDPSPRDRITLLFSKNQLLGIFHTRPIDIKGFKSYDLVRGHKFTPVAKLSDEKIKYIISKRIEFYNSID